MYQCTILCYSKNKVFFFIFVHSGGPCSQMWWCFYCLMSTDPNLVNTSIFLLKRVKKNTAVCSIGDEWVGVNTWNSPHIRKVSDCMTHCNVMKKPNSKVLYKMLVQSTCVLSIFCLHVSMSSTLLLST